MDAELSSTMTALVLVCEENSAPATYPGMIGFAKDATRKKNYQATNQQQQPLTNLKLLQRALFQLL